MPLKKIKQKIKGTKAGASSSTRDQQNAAYKKLLKKK